MQENHLPKSAITTATFQAVFVPVHFQSLKELDQRGDNSTMFFFLGNNIIILGLLVVMVVKVFIIMKLLQPKDVVVDGDDDVSNIHLWSVF